MKKILLVITILLTLQGYATAQELLALNESSAASTTATGSPGDLLALGQDDQVIFYPNPVKDNLSVKFPQRGSYTVRVFNIVGEKIAEKSVVDEDIVKLDLGNIPSGMYFLSYNLNGKSVTKTFSKS